MTDTDADSQVCCCVPPTLMEKAAELHFLDQTPNDGIFYEVHRYTCETCLGLVRYERNPYMDAKTCDLVPTRGLTEKDREERYR